MSPSSMVIIVAWDAMLLLGMWLIASLLHRDVHPGVTPWHEIARHWCFGMALFVSLLSPFPQSVAISAIGLSVYVTWGAVMWRPPAVKYPTKPQHLPRDMWQHVSGGVSDSREPM